eukprot:evm.model.NODE_19077_length_29818_cov_28.928265.8
MVDIKRDKLTMRNLGYGFVQMSTREEAAAAKERMQDVEIQGRRIRVGWAQRNTALFIGDLDASTTIDDLHRAFGLFGPLYEDQTYLRQGKYGKYDRAHDARPKLQRQGLALPEDRVTHRQAGRVLVNLDGSRGAFQLDNLSDKHLMTHTY